MQNPLRQWLADTGTTQVQLAEATKIPQSEISKYASGKRRPDLDNAFKIEAATAGAVPARAWARPDEEAAGGEAA